MTGKIVGCRAAFHSGTGRQVLHDALKAWDLAIPLEEIPPPKGDAKINTVSVYLSAANRERFESRAKRVGLSLGTLIERLAYGLYQASLKGMAESVVDSKVPEDERNRQVLLKELTDGLDAGQIILAEASTGMGKSRILGQAARHLLRSDSSHRVCVAAPTLSVMIHLLDEFQIVDPELKPAILLGRQQLISVRRLMSLWDEMHPQEDAEILATRPAVEAWLAQGAPPLGEDTRRLAQETPGLAYLMTDLISLAPGLNKKLVCLLRPAAKKETDPEPAEVILAEMKLAAQRNRLVLCTHAMLLWQTRTIAADDPLFYTHVILDEVHLFEAAAAAMEATEISLFSLRARLRRCRLARRPKGVPEVEALMSLLSSSDLQDGHLVQDSLLIDRIKESFTMVLNLLRSAPKGGKDRMERAQTIENLEKILAAKNSLIGVKFSPIRRYPAIFSGPETVGPLLGYLWKRLRGAAGLSGTIYLVTIGGGLSSGYTMLKLSIPPGRFRAVGPFIASWGKSTPTVRFPDQATAAKLVYPKHDDSLNEEVTLPALTLYRGWCETVAHAIQLGAEDAAGGMLVLCNAFTDIDNLSLQLASRFGDRLLIYRKADAIQRQKLSFQTMHQEGKRPIWLACGGGAWIGLDLRDKTAADPEKDTLLTDLVITRAPFGQERSSTFYARKIRMGFDAVIYEASFLFRQGVGRLVRRAGLRQRRLWILDGRLYTGKRSPFQAMTRILTDYPKREPFSLP